MSSVWLKQATVCYQEKSSLTLRGLAHIQILISQCRHMRVLRAWVNAERRQSKLGRQHPQGLSGLCCTVLAILQFMSCVPRAVNSECVGMKFLEALNSICILTWLCLTRFALRHRMGVMDVPSTYFLD